MIRTSAIALALAATLSLSSCYVFTHQVGAGGTTSPQAEQQWFILWGLVPLNHVDSHAMAGSATNYTVTTQFTPLDVIISLFTGWISIYVQTVEVKT